MTEIPVAFYAPLKSPRHREPSGDRTMARLLCKALRAAGFAPELASDLRTLDRAGRPDTQEELRAASFAEADRLIHAFRARSTAARPQAWFTYHVYYKAPDWIGPRVADALGIPYLVAEASRASKRAGGAWSLGHAGAEAALDRADAIFVLTALDRGALERDRPPRQRLIDLPPFIDLDEWGSALPPREGRAETGASAPARVGRNHGAGRSASGFRPTPLASDDASRPPLAGRDGTRLLTVAMMRSGDKLASYRLLAEALAGLADRPWVLDIVGDGEARTEIERLLAPFGARVRLHGRVEDRARLASLYEAADLFVWPAVNEAYGMVLLEAQAHGCPVVAGRYGGVASAMQDGRTGLLSPPGNALDFAATVLSLMDDAARRTALGEAAARFVREERGLAQAAATLRGGILPLLAVEAIA